MTPASLEGGAGPEVVSSGPGESCSHGGEASGLQLRPMTSNRASATPQPRLSPLLLSWLLLTPQARGQGSCSLQRTLAWSRWRRAGRGLERQTSQGVAWGTCSYQHKETLVFSPRN